jgi:hypothetical protein
MEGGIELQSSNPVARFFTNKDVTAKPLIITKGEFSGLGSCAPTHN